MKYINILDLAEYDIYQNINCRLLYLELAHRMDLRTREVYVSVRGIAADLGITYAACRHALGQLIGTGVVTQLATQHATQGATRLTTQATTHLRLCNYNDSANVDNALDSAPISAPKSAPISATNNAPSIKSNSNNNNISITLTRARELIEGFDIKDLQTYWDCSDYHADGIKDRYLIVMGIKGKSWSDEDDLKAHLLDWGKKNKKSIIKSLASAPPPEPEPTAPEPERPHPDWLTSDAWQWICNTVSRGDAAPEVLEEYEKGCAAMGTIPIYKL